MAKQGEQAGAIHGPFQERGPCSRPSACPYSVHFGPTSPVGNATRFLHLAVRIMKARKPLSVAALLADAAAFAKRQSRCSEPDLFGVTDGKAVGTHLEHKFQEYLGRRYTYERGNSARGIDFPGLGVDIKVTSIEQPQSSCPFKGARQKVYGLGYSLLVFVYAKHDDAASMASRIDVRHTVFVDKEQTGDFQMTHGLRRLLENRANRDDILAFFEERMLPADDVEAVALAEEVLRSPPRLGYLTVSNALQWRLQYARAIQEAGKVEGILRIT